MIHSQFHVDEWLDRFPLPEQPWKRHYGIVTSPVDACRIYQMREVLRDKIAWGNPVPTDVFIWGTGEPPDSRATKIGGIPHRPANSAWPDARDGEPMKFLAQICFADSLDLVRPLPGDVLLLFVGEMDFDEQELHCEWQPLDIEKPLTAELWRSRGYESRFATLHGAIWRTEAFPDATLRVPWEEAREATKALETFHATQIGTAPWWVQEQRWIRGQVIATLNSVYPWPVENVGLWVANVLPGFLSSCFVRHVPVSPASIESSPLKSPGTKLGRA